MICFKHRMTGYGHYPGGIVSEEFCHLCRIERMEKLLKEAVDIMESPYLLDYDVIENWIADAKEEIE